MIFSQKNQTLLVAGLILAAVLAGMALTFYATTYGPGVGGDATIYLTAAHNLDNGQGLGWTEADGSYRFLPYSPPFYPLVLSAAGLVFPDLVSVARWLNILFFGLMVAFLGWAFYHFTARPWLAVIMAAVLATSPVLIGVSVWAMSEPVGLLTGFAGLILLLLYYENHRERTLYFSALLVGLSFLSRYISVAFVVTACLALLVYVIRRSPFPSRARSRGLVRLLFYAVIAGLPMLIWLVVDFLMTGTVGSRSGQPASAYWQRFLEIAPALERIYLFWLLPESVIARLPGVVRLALWLLPLLLLLAAFALIFRRLRRMPTRPSLQPGADLALLMGLFILIYFVVLALVQVFTYPPITLAARMLSPVHVAVLVLVFTLLHLAWALFAPPARRLVSLLVYGLVLALLGTYALRGPLVARDFHTTGIGYTAPEWREAPIMEVVRGMPGSVPLVSNEVTALMFLTNRPAYTLQEIFRDQPQSTFTTYGSGEDASQVAFKQGAALVLFNATLQDDFAMYGEQVDERLSALTRGLYPFYQGEDGAIYFYERPSFLPSPIKH